MVKLAELGVCPQNELGRRTKMDAATIKGVVDRLVEKGLVSVNGDPEDRRRKLVALSDSGAAAIPELHSFGAKVSELTLEPLSEEERPALLRLVGLLT